MKLKDLPWEDEARAKALNELDKEFAYEVEFHLSNPIPTEGQKYSTRRRIGKGLVALYDNVFDFMKCVKNETGAGGQWLFKAILIEKYRNQVENEKNFQELYVLFRKDALGDKYEEWT